MKRKYFIIFTIIFMPLTSLGMPELNLNHLEFLRDEFQIENETKIGYWIYAEKYGDKYVHTEAKGEGVTCVDDVARVAGYILNYINLIIMNFICKGLKRP